MAAKTKGRTRTGSHQRRGQVDGGPAAPDGGPGLDPFALEGPSPSLDPTADRLQLIYRRLLQAFGPRGWWPGESPFEVMVGAVLTQNTAWHNVKQAIANLKKAKVLSPEGLDRLPLETLADLIRPSGYYRVKARRLKNMVALVMAGGGNDPPRILTQPLASLRQALLSVNGIGPETADSIILYAAEQPIFVIDAYTRRILSRHGLAREDDRYDQLQSLFMEYLPLQTSLYNEYHALLVHLGHVFCKPKPLCQDCPLNGI